MSMEDIVTGLLINLDNYTEGGHFSRNNHAHISVKIKLA